MKEITLSRTDHVSIDGNRETIGANLGRDNMSCTFVGKLRLGGCVVPEVSLSR